MHVDLQAPIRRAGRGLQAGADCGAETRDGGSICGGEGEGAVEGTEEGEGLVHRVRGKGKKRGGREEKRKKRKCHHFPVRKRRAIIPTQLKPVWCELRVREFAFLQPRRIGTDAGIHIIDIRDERGRVDAVEIQAPAGVIDAAGTAARHEAVDGVVADVFVSEGADVEVYWLQVEEGLDEALASEGRPDEDGVDDHNELYLW